MENIEVSLLYPANKSKCDNKKIFHIDLLEKRDDMYTEYIGLLNMNEEYVKSCLYNEEMYQKLTGEESVHLADYPKATKKFINEIFLYIKKRHYLEDLNLKLPFVISQSSILTVNVDYALAFY